MQRKKYAFTVKCGTNYEMHNHNDVGVFQIVRNGKRLIADLGAGEYTKGYFRDPEERFGEKYLCAVLCRTAFPLLTDDIKRRGNLIVDKCFLKAKEKLY